MRVLFSSHAEKRIKERGIKKEEVIDTIEFPEYSIRRGNNEIEVHKKIKGKILKVVYIEIENYKKVISLYYLD